MEKKDLKDLDIKTEKVNFPPFDRSKIIPVLKVRQPKGRAWQIYLTPDGNPITIYAHYIINNKNGDITFYRDLPAEPVPGGKGLQVIRNEKVAILREYSFIMKGEKIK